jgi:hypothetical protein
MVSKAVTHYEAMIYPGTINELEKHHGLATNTAYFNGSIPIPQKLV